MGLHPVFLYIGSFCASATFVYFLFEKMEVVLKKEIKIAFSRLLKNLDAGEEFENWVVTFGSFFDRIMGENHFSWKRFKRSCIASYLSLLVCFAILFSINPNTYYEKFSEGPIYLWVISFLVGGLAVNIFPDYLSYIQTRFFIKLFSKARSSFNKALIPILDIIATYLIFIIFTMSMVFIFMPGNDLNFKMYFNVLKPNFILGIIKRPEILLFLLTTFFTSTWLYLFLLSSALIKYGKFFTKNLDIDNKPFHSLGIVSMATVFIIYLIAAPFVLGK